MVVGFRDGTAPPRQSCRRPSCQTPNRLQLRQIGLERPQNRLPVYMMAQPPGSPDIALPQEPAPHPDHFDISRHLLTEPGLSSHYDSSTHLTLAAIPLAEISADTDHCFYVFDTRMRPNGIYLNYP